MHDHTHLNIFFNDADLDSGNFPFVSDLMTFLAFKPETLTTATPLKPGPEDKA